MSFIKQFFDKEDDLHEYTKITLAYFAVIMLNFVLIACILYYSDFILLIILFLISGFNAYLFFNNNRTYHLYKADDKVVNRSVNIKPVTIDTSTKRYSIIDNFFYYVNKLVGFGSSNTPNNTENQRIEVHELKLWTPNDWNKIIFRFFFSYPCYVLYVR